MGGREGKSEGRRKRRLRNLKQTPKSKAVIQKQTKSVTDLL